MQIGNSQLKIGNNAGDSRRVAVIGDSCCCCCCCCLSGYLAHVCVCVFCLFFFSLLFSYHFALAKLVMRRSSESAVYCAFVPNATPLASSSPSSCPPLSAWHWRVGSLSALQVLNSVTTNQNRLEIAQFALRWLPPTPSPSLPSYFSTISTDLTDWKPDWLSRFLNANCIDCAARDLG